MWGWLTRGVEGLMIVYSYWVCRYGDPLTGKKFNVIELIISVAFMIGLIELLHFRLKSPGKKVDGLSREAWLFMLALVCLVILVFLKGWRRFD